THASRASSWPCAPGCTASPTRSTRSPWRCVSGRSTSACWQKMSDHRAYPADHPAIIALVAMATAVYFRVSLLEALAERAARFGIAFGSQRFDQVAEAAGMPYCRALDLYVDRQTKARAEA